MAADNNYYGYSYNVASSQYGNVTGNSAYATGMHADHTMPAQSAYPQSQTTVQYGPYGSRSQATAMPASQGFGEASLQYYGAADADSYYTQKTQSQSASAAYQTGSSYDQSYASVNQDAASLEWQQQMKQTYSQSYNNAFVPAQSSSISSGTGYATGASVNQYSSTPSVNQYTSASSVYQYNSALSGSQYSSASSVSQYSTASAASTTAPSVSSYSGFDAAVYSAATDYLIQKQRGEKGSNWYKNFKESHGSPDQSQWKYCELCKCTCAGIWAYRAHLSGKAHKKREQMGPVGESVNPTASNDNSLTCQLCDVVCSSTDAYAAHMRGLKHQRILKLQLKMGKPIPELMSPEMVAAKTPTSPSAKILKTNSGYGKKMGYRTHRMSYAENKQMKAGFAFGQSAEEQSDDSQLDYDIEDKNAQPIGLEYIEESLNETGTAPVFYCKLCDCSFTDPLAKTMHTKGRRHRFQYKKKVDPLLKVDTKGPPFNSMELEKIPVNRRNVAGELWRQKELQESYKQEAEDLRYEKELLQWQLEKTAPKFVSAPPSWAAAADDLPLSEEKPCFLEMEIRRDNDYVSAKHAAVYPTEEDLSQVQKLVSTCEKALKLVSDRLASLKIERDLKGVMRVGQLAKGLLLHDSLDFELVVLCSYRPTKALLRDIMDSIPVQLKTFTEEKYELTLAPDASGFIFTAAQEVEQKVKITCSVSLTCSAVSPYSEDVQRSASGIELDSFRVQPCLKALAALRHAKWFQAKAANLHPCVIVIRLMMDFCKRVTTWSIVTQWSLELLVEKIISSENARLSPAVALRRLLEAVASGILLPDGPGILDPCEKTPTDAFEYLNPQEREDLTNSAQHAVRMMAFGDIYKVLGMDPFPDSARVANKSNKRKRDSSS